MARVLTNNVGMSYTIETSLGVAGVNWFLVEPNTFTSFGANITSVSRDPISRNRQRQKGTVTDLDSTVEFDADLTASSFLDFMEGFAFVTGINSDVSLIVSTAAETTTDTYAVSALTLAQADKFEIDTLIWVSGFSIAANNGLKVINSDIAQSAIAITVAENLTDEAVAPAGARISIAGHRIATAAVVTWDWNAVTVQASLLLTGVGTILTALGLTPGMTVHIGSIVNAGDTTITSAFENAAANDMFGFARVVSIAADVVVFDKVDLALQFDDLTAPATAVDVLFGQFIRNVSTSSAEFLERSFQFELEFPNLDVGGASEFQYALGNFSNTVAFSLPLADKASITFGFIGTDTENPVVAASRKAGASTALNPTLTEAFNTSADIARLRITNVDESGLTTDFKSVTITLNNNVSPEKVLGVLGAKFINAGNFEINIEAALVFTNPAVVDKIRTNATVTMDFILKNGDGIISVDIPSMTLGGGGREFPVNQSVLINTTAEAFQDSLLGTSIGISTIPVPLP